MSIIGFLLQIALVVFLARMAFAWWQQRNAPAGAGPKDVRDVLWHLRHLDVLGQIVILLAGAFGVVVLLKESKRE